MPINARGWSFKGAENQIFLHEYGPMLKIHWAFYIGYVEMPGKDQSANYLLSVGQLNCQSPGPGTLDMKEFGLLTYSLKHEVKEVEVKKKLHR